MNKTNKMIATAIIVAMLLLGIGYASVENITLNIGGTAEADPIVPVFTRTLAEVTNENIGEYIDLGNNIVGTEATTDDWRILYKEGDTVYAILADYLPASQVPAEAGLTTNPTEYPYSVWSNTNRNTLINGLKNETAWSSFANGITGATVTGTPTAELLMNSYNTKNGTNLTYTSYPTLDSGIEDYNLYLPHTSSYENCLGYWFASPAVYSNRVWSVNYMGYVDCRLYDGTNYCVRPVVSLSSSISCNYENGIWILDTGKEPSQTPSISTIGDITNLNIGEYIDLGNNIIGTDATTDDWRILYKDGDTVYAILADYLPASQVPASAGLTTNPTKRPYSVWSETDRNTLLNGLKNTTVWNNFANEIVGATVTGAPTAELLMSSYNTKNGANLVYTETSRLDSATEDYNLYVPTFAYEDFTGYWLASPYVGYTSRVWYVYRNGDVDFNTYDYTNNGVRPVVSLPLNTLCSYENGIWTVEK